MTQPKTPIKIPFHVFQKFLDFALEYAPPSKPRQTWKEVLGFLIGRINENDLIITDVICETAGTAAFVKAEDYVGVISNLLESGKITKGESIVGWIHTHPGLGLFFSSTDINTQALYQKLEPFSIGVVLDPAEALSPTTGPGLHAYVVSEGNTAVQLPVIVEDMEDLQLYTTQYVQLINNRLDEIIAKLDKLMEKMSQKLSED